MLLRYVKRHCLLKKEKKETACHMHIEAYKNSSKNFGRIFPVDLTRLVWLHDKGCISRHHCSDLHGFLSFQTLMNVKPNSTIASFSVSTLWEVLPVNVHLVSPSTTLHVLVRQNYKWEILQTLIDA